MLDRTAGPDGVFKALASPVRREILFHLRGGELAAGDIAARFRIAAPTVSRHLGVLKTAGLVRERRAANRILYSASPTRVRAVLNEFVAAALAEEGDNAPASRREESP